MQPGDEFVAARQLYGGSINQFNHSFKSFGWNVKWADIDDIASFEKAIDAEDQGDLHRSRSPIPAASSPTSRRSPRSPSGHGVPLIVDNTLATPYLCRPFEHGADIVVHSLTKFIGGHGNSIGGIIVDGGKFNWLASKRYPILSEPRPGIQRHGARRDLRQLRLRHRLPRARPARPRPGDLAVQLVPHPDRHRRRCRCACRSTRDNAKAVAEFLAGHDKVTWVSYAGLPGDRYHQLAQKYCPKGAGAVLTFGVEGGDEAGIKLVSKVKLFSHLANIGDTRSLIIHPVVDDPQPADRRAAQGGRRRAGRGAPVGRHRGRRRHHRRPRPGAGRGLSAHLDGRRFPRRPSFG